MSTHTAVETNTVVTVEHLTRRFGRHFALDDVSLEIPRGSVFGLVGENGAGKTTLIKHLLGLLVPTSGKVCVFGRNPVADPPGVLSRVGYLSEDRDLPDWMKLWELIRYTRAFYPGWDDNLADEYIHTFGLDLNAKIGSLSRGQRAQAGLLIALAYRPELLILDEPSSGLDPVVRRDILGAIVRTVADEGRTVLFSSHFLDEVERLADTVALVHQSKLVLSGPLDEVRARHHRVLARFTEARHEAPKVPGLLSSDGGPHEWTLLCEGDRDATLAELHTQGAEILESTAVSLEDIFVARVGGGRGLREREN